MQFIITLTGVWMGLTTLCTPAARADATPSPASPSITAREAFVKLPLGSLDLLKRTTRLDMLDYFDADSIWIAPNVMEGTSRLKAVTPDYLSAEITDVSTLTIRILPSSKGPMVMTLYTIGKAEEGPDTEIQFFDASLNPLETKKFISLPSPDDFLDIPKGVDRKEIEGLLPFPTIKWETAEGQPILTAHITLGNHLPIESADRIRPYLRPKLTWTWTGSKWKRAK